MSTTNAFPDAELAGRVAAVRRLLAERDLDAAVLAVPENIYYLTGLDHWGYFACHILIVPRDGGMVLSARAMEGGSVANQVTNARFEGHSDDEEAGAFFAGVLTRMGLGGARLGLEKKSLFLTAHIAETMAAGVPGAAWSDCSGMVDALRLVKSPLEQGYTRKAAAAADAGTMAAIAAIHDGASDYAVAAECHRAMILAGSEYPGFGPFVRSTRQRPGDEHTTWRGDTFTDGDPVLLEIGAAYRKYQAPMGRLVYVGSAPEGTAAAAGLAIRGMEAVVAAVEPGATAGSVYDAWQQVAWDAGLTGYRRHHCGYLVGIAFPPSWTGGSSVIGLKHGSPLVLEVGMVFHLHSWFTGTGRGDYFISNTAMLTEAGCETLTHRTPVEMQVR